MQDSDCQRRIQEIKQADIDAKDKLICSLGDSGSWARPCLPLLLSLFNDPIYHNSVDLGGAMLYAVNEIGLGSCVAKKEFLDLLDNSIPEVRHWALGLLRFYHHQDHIPYVTGEVVEKVIKMLPESDPPSTPIVVTQLLARWYPEVLDRAMGITSKGMSYWENSSQHGSMGERIEAIIAFSVFGEQGVPPLTRLFACDDVVIRSCILWASSLIGQPANELITRASHDADPEIRKLATLISQCGQV
jgi:hypothetical protein